MKKHLFLKQSLSLFIACILLSQEGCYRRPSGEDVLARVGDAVLTTREALQFVDSSHGDVEGQLRRYVASWVNNELIYQEAKRHSIESMPEYQEKVSLMRREILVQEFLRQFLSIDTLKLTDEQLHQYYVDHQKEFFLREQTIKVNAIGFRSREHASAFGASIARGLSWDSVVVSVRKSPKVSREIIAEISQRYVTQMNLFPEELWKVALTLNINEPSYPVKTMEGYFIVQVVEHHQSGNEASYDLAKDEARERFMIEQTRNRYAELLGTLRLRTAVEVMLPNTPPADTAQSMAE